MLNLGRITAFLLLTVCVVRSLPAYAVGTPAGVDISSSAVATYQFGGTEVFTKSSNTVIFTVAEVLDLSVALQNVSDVYVASGAVNQVMTFLVTNNGNGTENYLLSVDNGLPGDDFDPVFVGVFFDSNGSGVFEAGIDALTTQTGPLAADASVLVFAVNNIPSAADQATGFSRLEAQAATGSGAPGDIIANGGDGGVIDAVVGNSGASAGFTGTYSVANVSVVMTKNSTVQDLNGGSRPETGATITYSLIVAVTGTGVAEAIVVNDAIPAGTTYVANSLEWDVTSGSGSAFVALTDAADADVADFDITNTGAVTVNLGDLPANAVSQHIRFKVTID